MQSNISQNFLQIMASAGIAFDDAYWFHCQARLKKVLDAQDMLRLSSIQLKVTSKMMVN